MSEEPVRAALFPSVYFRSRLPSHKEEKHLESAAQSILVLLLLFHSVQALPSKLLGPCGDIPASAPVLPPSCPPGSCWAVPGAGPASPTSVFTAMMAGAWAWAPNWPRERPQRLAVRTGWWRSPGVGGPRSTGAWVGALSFPGCTEGLRGEAKAQGKQTREVEREAETRPSPQVAQQLACLITGAGHSSGLEPLRAGFCHLRAWPTVFEMSFPGTS